MLDKVLQLKVNFAIVFVGTLLIMLLIKVTSVLVPAKYYFNFSKLVAGDSEPLIVDPPSVTGAKLCEIMTRYAIPKETFGRPVSCSASFENALSPDQVDKVYSIALRSDQAVRDAYADVMRRVAIRPLTDAEIKAIAAKNATVGLAFEAIYDQYANQIREIVDKGASKTVSALYNDIVPERQYDDSQSDTVPTGRGLSDDLSRRVAQANQGMAAELTNAALAQKIPPIKKSSVDDIVRRIQAGGGEVGFNVMSYYTNGLLVALREAMSRKFSDLGLPAGKGFDRKIIFGEITSFSWKNYVLSILLRLTPVFLFGLVLGAAVGRGELFSIALAGGLTAFLLSWPLMLMWDRLVQSNWSDKRPLFLGLYAVYIVSFFATARSAALLGVWLREQRFASLAAQSTQGVGAGIRVTWREVAINIAGAVILNGMVYAWNLFIPLSMSSPQ